MFRITNFSLGHLYNFSELLCRKVNKVITAQFNNAFCFIMIIPSILVKFGAEVIWP